MNRRIVAIVLGIVGGLIGLFFASLFVIVGLLLGAVTGELKLVLYSVGAMILSILGMVGAFLAILFKERPKLGSVTMLTSGLINLFLTIAIIVIIKVPTGSLLDFFETFSLFFGIIISALFLILAGFLSSSD